MDFDDCTPAEALTKAKEFYDKLFRENGMVVNSGLMLLMGDDYFKDLIIQSEENLFVMGFLFGYCNEDIEVCKSTFPEFDWDGKTMQKAINIMRNIIV